jgi:hypothetical protein
MPRKCLEPRLTPRRPLLIALACIAGCGTNPEFHVQTVPIEQPSLRAPKPLASQPLSRLSPQPSPPDQTLNDRIIHRAGWQLQPIAIRNAGQKYLDSFEIEQHAQGRWLAVFIEVMNISPQQLSYDDIPIYDFALLTSSGQVLRDYRLDDREGLVQAVYPREVREVVLLFDVAEQDTPAQLIYRVTERHAQPLIHQIDIATELF